MAPCMTRFLSQPSKRSTEAEDLEVGCSSVYQPCSNHDSDSSSEDWSEAVHRGMLEWCPLVDAPRCLSWSVRRKQRVKEARTEAHPDEPSISRNLARQSISQRRNGMDLLSPTSLLLRASQSPTIHQSASNHSVRASTADMRLGDGNSTAGLHTPLVGRMSEPTSPSDTLLESDPKRASGPATHPAFNRGYDAALDTYAHLCAVQHTDSDQNRTPEFTPELLSTFPSPERIPEILALPAARVHSAKGFVSGRAARFPKRCPCVFLLSPSAASEAARKEAVKKKAIRARLLKNFKTEAALELAAALDMATLTVDCQAAVRIQAIRRGQNVRRRKRQCSSGQTGVISQELAIAGGGGILKNDQARETIEWGHVKLRTPNVQRSLREMTAAAS